jgi:hypothetical protein
MLRSVRDSLVLTVLAALAATAALASRSAILLAMMPSISDGHGFHDVPWWANGYAFWFDVLAPEVIMYGAAAIALCSFWADRRLLGLAMLGVFGAVVEAAATPWHLTVGSGPLVLNRAAIVLTCAPFEGVIAGGLIWTLAVNRRWCPRIFRKPSP